MVQPTNGELALQRLGTAEMRAGLTDDQRHAVRLEAVTFALLAVAYEVREVRYSVNNVEDALEDQDGFGVGVHSRNASDWLEKIAKQ